MASFKIPFIDASAERSTFQVNVSDLITDLDITALHAALFPLWIDGDQQSSLVVETDKDGTDQGKATNKLAQRENKFLFSYRDDTTGDLYSAELPCADLTETDSSASIVDLGSGTGLAAKNAWDTHVLSRVGNPTTLEEIKFVGRNL